MKLNIMDVLDKEDCIEVQVELPDLRRRCFKFVKGHGWFDKVEQEGGVKKERFLIHIENHFKKKKLLKDVKETADFDKIKKMKVNVD